MNRIYQGRVSRAEILDEKSNVISPPECRERILPSNNALTAENHEATV